MKIFYCDHFVLPLPPEHRFPMRKYSRLRRRVADSALGTLHVPDPASDADLLRVHSADYLGRVTSGALDRAAVRRIGFPWSPGLVERSRRSVGGTLGACRAALIDGAAVNLAGGTHHAGPDRGEGFCVFNDVAVAARAMQAEGRVGRVAVVDCDVHQGNGTALVFRDDPSVFTFSIHGAHNYPFEKPASRLDVALPDGAGDTVYLEGVERGLVAVQEFAPDLVLYIAGADPYAGDRLGRLAVSKAGLAERDRRVFDRCRRAGVPVATVMGGGYAPDIEDIVDIHHATVAEAAAWVGAQPAGVLDSSTSR